MYYCALTESPAAYDETRVADMSEEMTSLERCLATIRLQPHDRVPVDLHNFMMTIEGQKLPSADLYRNGQLLGEAQIAAWKRFGHDMLIVENGTAALAEACGCKISYLPGSAPVCHEPLLADLSQVSSLKKPDPRNSPLCKAVLDASQLILDRIGDQVYVMGRADQGPLSLACMLAGPETLLTEMAAGESDEQIFELLEYASDAFIQYANMFKEMGCHGTSAGEGQGSPDVISPAMYKRYCLPYARKIVNTVQSDDFFLSYHICGNTTKILDAMCATGASLLELDYKCDKSAAKKATAGMNTIIGPIDPSGVLHQGSVADVEKACREAIDILAPGGGFILGAGCALPGTTPPENVDKLVECAKLYGKY
jgi:uroporphyrinogen decarboxylase